jgi:predicted lipoprotein with Yx(FWY)xxD motif
MRRLAVLLSLLLCAVGLAACGGDDDGGAVASDDATTTTTAAPTTTTGGDDATMPAGSVSLAVASTGLGDVLVDAEGMTVYLFTPDTADASACTEGCAQAWPPLLVDGAASGGDGVDASLLGTAPREDGSMQATYNGHRLYRYSGDTAPGDTTGQGVGGKWFAVTPAGEPVPA